MTSTAHCPKQTDASSLFLELLPPAAHCLIFPLFFLCRVSSHFFTSVPRGHKSHIHRHARTHVRIVKGSKCPQRMGKTVRAGVGEVKCHKSATTAKTRWPPTEHYATDSARHDHLHIRFHRSLFRSHLSSFRKIALLSERKKTLLRSFFPPVCSSVLRAVPPHPLHAPVLHLYSDVRGRSGEGDTAPPQL